jgi:glucose/arabinose dehydrogenase
MTVDPGGTLLVSLPTGNEVIALPDRRGRGRADRAVTVAEGLDWPHGIAFTKNGDLLIADTGQVRRFHYTRYRATDPVVVAPDLPPGGIHATRSIAVNPDGSFFVSVGSSCNVCRESDLPRASILRYAADGTGGRRFATGIRNAVGLAIQPGTGALWASVNGRDLLGDDLPPDYLTEVRDGGFYGWPDCYALHERAVPDPDMKPAPEVCQHMTMPTIEIQAHSAPLGMAFYTGRQFPEEYRGSLFVAYHGSWNRSVKTGYKIVRIPFRDGKPGKPEDFATGWVMGDEVSGRPVGLQVTPDGSLYVSDDADGAIYRITYTR